MRALKRIGVMAAVIGMIAVVYGVSWATSARVRPDAKLPAANMLKDRNRSHLGPTLDEVFIQLGDGDAIGDLDD